MSEQLTWISLSKRRENSCLILFYKIINNLAVAPHSCLEKADVRTRKNHSQKFHHIGYNIDPYGQLFIPNCISAWNGFAKDIAEAQTLVQKSTAFKWLNCCCTPQHKLYSPLLPPAMGAFSTVYWADRPNGPTGWLALLLLNAGDVETNPGPKHTRTQVWICDICHREINRKQTSLRCNHSEHWVHLRCAHIRVDQYTDTWICHLHRGSRLPHATHTSPHFPLSSSKTLLHLTPNTNIHQSRRRPPPPPKMTNPRLPKPLIHSPPIPLPRPQTNRYTSHTKHLHLAPPHASQSRHARQMLQNLLYRLVHHPQQTPR